ncbi:hypothetical protein F383_31961 [Gossypium arboreum]|uniref:Uncharacterized protein n=1 Tax=Gossypium arboreum TaxID=29729 RepID=A0A0B0PKL9_GOSAR|nr:hypothetical protein F383_31961 [Gossypium arboreum]
MPRLHILIHVTWY